MNFYFKIAFLGGEFSVNPTFSNCKAIYKKEDDMMFYRKKIADTFIFSGADYNLLDSVKTTPCERIFLNIYKKCDDSLYWQGFTSYYELVYDEDRCEIQTKFAPYDKYTLFLENYHKKFNLFNPQQIDILQVDVDSDYSGLTQIVANPLYQAAEMIKTRVNTNGYHYQFPRSGGDGSIPTVLGRFDKNTESPPAQYRARRVEYFTTDNRPQSLKNRLFQIITEWVTEQIYTQDVNGVANEPPGGGWVDLGIDATTGTRKWQRKPFPTIGDTGLPGDFAWKKVESTKKISGKIQNIVYFYIVNWIESSGNITYRNGLSFESTLQRMYQVTTETDVVAVDSLFFFSDINPVTNRENELKELVIFQKSDIVRFRATQRATVLEVSMKDMLEQLREMFNAYWDITDNGRFRIEHISFYKNYFDTYKINTTAGLTVNERSKNKYSFLRDEMYTSEKWNIPEAFLPDFVGTEINYNNVCAKGRDGEFVKTRNITIATDVLMAQQFPDAFDLKGMFLIVNGSLQISGKFYNGQDVILGEPAGFNPNIHLSLSNLHHFYWRHERILLNGEMNNLEQEFLSKIRIKKRVEINTSLCCEQTFSADDYVNGDGWENGEVTEAELDLKTGLLKLNLIYESEY